MTPVPGGEITTSEILVPEVVPDLDLIQEETIDTKGYSVKLIEKIADIIMMGGYAEQVAVNVIELVTNWKEPKTKAVPK